MTPRIITADVARELLHSATEGPWEVGVASSWQGSVRVESEMYVRRPGDNVALAAQVIDPRTEEISESNARLLATAPDLAHTVVAQAAEIERLRASLDRAHYALREWGPGCEHPGCNNLAPLRCEDCGARFCDDHDGGSAGHDSGVATPMPHAVGPDDLMAGVAMREAQVAR